MQGEWRGWALIQKIKTCTPMAWTNEQNHTQKDRAKRVCRCSTREAHLRQAPQPPEMVFTQQWY